MADDVRTTDQYDDELDVEFTPPISDLVRVMRANLTQYLQYLASDPPLDALKAKASEIMEAIQAASGQPGAEDLAIKLALAVDTRFERLGLGRSWYLRLIQLWTPAVERGGELGEAHLYKCLMNHYVHSGDMVNASKIINGLLDIATLNPDAPVQDAMVGAATVATSLADTKDGKILAEQLLELANLTGNYLLMGRAYGVLNRFHASQLDAGHSFEYGQMVYCVGSWLKHDVLIQNGLHFMALAFQVGNQPERAQRYLERLKQYSAQAGDVGQSNYLWYTLGACSYQTANYTEAELCFRNSLNSFAPGTWPHTTALYMLGLSLMRLKQFKESEQHLLNAFEAWGRQSRAFDQLYARHALAHLRWFQQRYSEAVEIAEQTLAEAEKSESIRRDQLLTELRADLERYKQSLRDAASSEIMIDYVHK